MPSPPGSLEDLLPEISRRASAGSRGETEPDASSSVLSTLRDQLIRRIEDLLTHRRELLMSVLYRVDVKESLVVDAFRELPYEALAPRLADLIIERQLEKVRSRRTYRSGKTDDTWL